MADEKLSFEDALAKLETIVRDVEEGKIGLEDSIRRYEDVEMLSSLPETSGDTGGMA